MLNFKSRCHDTFWRHLYLVSLFFIFVGCGPTRCGSRVDVAPEDQLRNYIDLAVNITRIEQREELESLTTGEFREQLTSISPEDFKKAYLDRRYEFEVFEVTSKNEIEPGREMLLEYRVKFRSWVVGEDKTRAPQQETKSAAKMLYTNGQWAIASIQPADAEYNWDIGLPLEGVSTQGVTPESPVVDPFDSQTSESGAAAGQK
jgi:hypothetical protein